LLAQLPQRLFQRADPGLVVQIEHTPDLALHQASLRASVTLFSPSSRIAGTAPASPIGSHRHDHHRAGVHRQTAQEFPASS